MRLRASILVFIVSAAAAAAACSAFSSDDAATPVNAGEAGAPDGAVADTSTPADDAGPVADAALSAYRAAVLADGPIAYWRMNLVTGTIADETGKGHTLAVVGGTTAVPAPASATNDGDPALKFDGTSGAATSLSPRDFDFAGGAPFTLELWARRQALVASGDYRHLFSANTSASGTNQGYMLYESIDGGTLQFELNHGTGGVTSTVPLPVAVAWHHYAAVFDGTTLTFYVDGDLKTTHQPLGNMTSRVSDVMIARRSTEASGYYSGVLDEIAVYPKALTPDRITTHIAVAKGP